LATKSPFESIMDPLIVAIFCKVLYKVKANLNHI